MDQARRHMQHTVISNGHDPAGQTDTFNTGQAQPIPLEQRAWNEAMWASLIGPVEVQDTNHQFVFFPQSSPDSP